MVSPMLVRAITAKEVWGECHGLVGEEVNKIVLQIYTKERVIFEYRGFRTRKRIKDASAVYVPDHTSFGLGEV